MPTMTIRENGVLDSVSRGRSVTIEADVSIKLKKTLIAAKTGQLTTRTDNDTGTLTMTGGHGIVTADKIFIFWTDPTTGILMSRRSIVGTVAVNSVPIDLGAGDNLPTNLTNVTVSVANSESVLVTGNSVTAIQFYAARNASVQVTDASDVELDAHTLEAGEAYLWYTGSGVTSPLAGDAVAKVKFGNGDSAGTCAVEANFLYN